MNQEKLKEKIDAVCRLLIGKKGFICAVDVLLELNYLTKENYDRWRKGKSPYLEQVCNANLNRLTFINTTIRKVANELNLQKSWTAYQRYGKGPAVRLRFSKSGDKNIEEMYATHYLDKKRILEIQAARKI